MTALEHPIPIPTAGSGPDDAARAHARRWWILAVLALAQLMVVLDSTVVNIALPSAQHALGFSNADRQWVVTAYSLAFGGLLLLGGRLSDYFGRRRMFMIGLVGFGAASALGGLATGFPLLVAARGIQGAFGAILAPAALSLMTTTFSNPEERGKAFGVYGAIAGAGGAIGLILGGALTQYLDWRWCLYINVILAAVGLVGAAVVLVDQARSSDTHLDIPGTLTVVGGLVGIVYGFSEADTAGWSSPLTIGLLVAGVILLAVFAWVETRVEHPLLPLRVILDRTRGASYLAVGFVGTGLFGVFLFLTYYLQQDLGYAPLKTGLSFLPMVVALAVMSNLATNVILPRFGPRVSVVPGMVLAASGMFLLTRLGLGSSYLTSVVPALVLLGMGLGVVSGTCLNLGPAGAPPADAGVASAMVNTAQQVGGSIGTALLNTIAASATTSYLVGRAPSRLLAAHAQVHGDTTAFAVVVGVFLVAAVVTCVVYRPGRIEVDPDVEPAPAVA
jgi:EmrB/QacA subfamily drug resistance transporter